MRQDTPANPTTPRSVPGNPILVKNVHSAIVGLPHFFGSQMIPLIVENVSKSYLQGQQSVRALSGISLDVADGTFLAIMGASGSGKSTLLHLMAGLAHCDQGSVKINGQDLAQMPDAQLTRFAAATSGWSSRRLI